ncbi:M24 family metallopeptidase [Chloroflexota bacterium]
MVSIPEIERRNLITRQQMQSESVDALIVCGNQYSGFEGAVRYISGFEIVHRYVYVLLPLDDDSKLVFPTEARWIGDKSKTWVKDKVWAPVPGEWLHQYAKKRKWKRIGVYGLENIMTVSDYRELVKGPYQLVPFNHQFDMARAVKSDEELTCIRNSMDIIVNGFWSLVNAYEPGKTETEIMAPVLQLFASRSASSRMMNLILSGTGGEADVNFKLPGSRQVSEDDLMIYSLEITAQEGYWVEFSRPLIRGKASATTQAMMGIYPEAIEAARLLMHEGQTTYNVHTTAAQLFARHGSKLGHLTGHSIGMSMIEHPEISAKIKTKLRENMVISFHPQVVDKSGTACLYMQDTYRIGKTEGECLASIPIKFFRGNETPPIRSKVQ